MLWEFVDNGLKGELLFIGGVFEGGELFHKGVFLMATLDKIKAIGSEESVDF